MEIHCLLIDVISNIPRSDRMPGVLPTMGSMKLSPPQGAAGRFAPIFKALALLDRSVELLDTGARSFLNSGGS